ncbi:hypothetical protein A6R68_05386, partial [Neotoma lepida]
MELYTGLQKLTIKNSGLRNIQPRAFAKNPHLRYINLSSNRLTTLSWQLFQTLSLRELSKFPVCDHSVYQEAKTLDLCLGYGPFTSSFHLPTPVFMDKTNLNWTNVHAINLTLVNVTSEDNGFTLTCIAENVVGMSNASVALTVYYPPRVVSLVEPEVRLEHCIEFVVRGNPTPTLHWLYNGQPLRESKIIHMDYYQEGEVSEGCLLFNKPTHYNNGNYTLIAKNALGTANQTINGHFLKEPFPESTDFFDFESDASPTPPITVTHKPEEDTF